MGTTCGHDPKYDELAKRNLPQLSQIVKKEEALNYVDSQFPSLLKRAEKNFDKLLPSCLDNINQKKSQMTKQFQTIKQNVVQRYGSLSNFEKQTGKTLPKYLDSQVDIEQFNQFLKRADSEFRAKKQFLLTSLQNQKKMYQEQQRKDDVACQAYDNLRVEEQKQLYDIVRSHLKPEIEQNNKAQWRAFEQAMGLPMYEKNLLLLEAIKRSDEHYRATFSKWNNQIQKLN